MIRIEGLGKVYSAGIGKKSSTALQGLNLEVRQGEIFGFLGPNGAGKTTTLKILMGLIYPTSGRAWLMDRELGDVRVKERIGYLPEHPYFYDYLTSFEFLDFYGRLFGLSKVDRKDRIGSLLGKVGLKDARDMQLRKFSKGMLQRIGIAQALINDPQLVVLDEPMSGLDPIGRKEVRDIILWLKESGKTVFFSTHILPDVEMVCDRVGIIVKGVLRDVGCIEDLLGATVRSVEIVVQGAAGLSDVLGERGISCSGAGDKVSITVTGAGEGGGVDEIIRSALDSGGRIVSVTPHKKTLEEIFVEHVAGGSEGRQ